MSQISYYSDIYKKEQEKDVSILDYISMVRTGFNQDDVIKARLAKQNGDNETYTKLKAKQPCLTASCTMNGKDKTENSIKSLNGYIVIDIDSKVDELTLNKLKGDEYTSIIHRSFGGEGVCIFVKINTDRFLDSFNGLALYYLQNYSLVIDQSCKNKNRLRYLSFDPDIYHNDKGRLFKNYPKKQKEKAPKVILIQSDFDAIVTQITSQGIDITDSEYDKFLKVGFSLASEFGEGGLNYFHNIVQFSHKYNQKVAEKQYLNCCKSNNSGITLASLYYYCKEAGITTYSEKTKTIISTTSQYKRRGGKKEDVYRNLEELDNIEVNEEVKKAVDDIYNSKEKLDKNLNDDESEICQIERFIESNYKPRFNEFKNVEEIFSGDPITDRVISSIYINAQKSLPFNVNKGDVLDVLNSSELESYNPLTQFLEEHKNIETNNELEKLTQTLITNQGLEGDDFDPNFIPDMVKKWFVSLFSCLDGKYSPLVLVLQGKQGDGKSYWLEKLLPPELQKYSTNSNLEGGKDDLSLMHEFLLIINDEFGGQTVKDAKAFKELVSKNYVKYRPSYARKFVEFKRIALFAGTTNEDEILNDSTGNRRIIPIRLEGIHQQSYNGIDKTALLIDAYKNYYLKNYDYSILKTDIERLNNNTKDFEIISTEEDLVNQYCEVIESHTYGKTTTEVITFVGLQSNYKGTLFPKKISAALKKIGATSKAVKKNGKNFRLWNVELT